MNILKPSLAALGLSAALAAGSASAAITLDENGVIFLEDDDIDFHFRPNDTGGIDPMVGGGQLLEGDVLLSVVEFNDVNGDAVFDVTDSQELTGVLAGQIVDITGGELTFSGYGGGLQSILDAYGYTGDPIPQGGAGEGALGALWLGDPDLDISADSLSSGSLSCDNLTDCVVQATDGDLWQVDGFTGELDATWGGVTADAGSNEFWLATGNPLFQDTSIVLATNPALELTFFNVGAQVFLDGSGLGLDEGPGVDCFPFCSVVPDTEFIDVLVGGSIKGGDGLQDTGMFEDGAVATSDFDLTKTGVPEPSSLALLAAGFIGVGVGAARLRRRRKV